MCQWGRKQIEKEKEEGKMLDISMHGECGKTRRGINVSEILMRKSMGV
jgi:hypothetical protein